MDKFTWAQFQSLPRVRGRITILPDVFLSLTDEMVNVLHSDDWSYYMELQEEVRILAKEFE